MAGTEYASPLLQFVPHDHSGPTVIALARLQLTMDAFEVREFEKDADDVDAHRRLWAMKRDAVPEVRERYMRTIEAARAQGANIVVFGEMTYPALGRLEEDEPFEKQLQECADAYGMHVVAGSSHQVQAPPAQRYNMSRIFVPQADKPFEQKKHISAHRTGEIVDIPPVPRVTVLGMAGCNYGVIICADATDGNLSRQIGKQNGDDGQCYRPIHVLMCPSFSYSSAMFDRAHVFANQAQAHVAIVNGLDDPGVGICALYRPGLGAPPLDPFHEDDELSVYHVKDFSLPVRRVAAV